MDSEQFKHFIKIQVHALFAFISLLALGNNTMRILYYHDKLKAFRLVCAVESLFPCFFFVIQGCGRSKHNPVKPVEEPKPQSTNTDDIVPEVRFRGMSYHIPLMGWRG